MGVKETSKEALPKRPIVSPHLLRTEGTALVASAYAGGSVGRESHDARVVLMFSPFPGDGDDDGMGRWNVILFISPRSGSWGRGTNHPPAKVPTEEKHQDPRHP